MRTVVGISQKIKRAWLDVVLDRLVQTTDETDLRMFLDHHLREELPGKASRAKASGIILRIWSGIPRAHRALRDHAVALLPRISGQERVWLHWGMTALAYPFFRDTAEVVGRLLALQDDCTTAQVQARIMTTWGDRATSKEAAQKLLTTWVDWEVLRSTKTKGHFLLARKMTTSIPDLQLWLLEALLGASAADEIEAQQVLRLPEGFPFTLNIGVADLRKHEEFTIHRQGLDMDIVALRQVKGEPPSKLTKKPGRKLAAQPVQPSLFEPHAAEAVSGTGQPMPVVRVTSPTVDEKQDGVDEPHQIEASIRHDVQPTLAERAARVRQVRGMVRVPDGPFAAPAAECAAQFRDGCYFSCIALTQAVLEAAVRHMWQVTHTKKPHQGGSFAHNLDALHKRQIISDAWKTKLAQVWADRHTFLSLRPSEESDRQQLADTAHYTLQLLNELAQAFFGFVMRDGIVVPNRPADEVITDGEAKEG
jgi:hypothetical protein